MSNTEHYFKTNKATWNEKVKVHAKSEMYDLGDLFNVLNTAISRQNKD
ncbi:hypothetical protein [Seonamhaeicola sp. S2-3]|nr:hypothetical protein [Seonamhaeicola sp. S2-3]